MNIFLLTVASLIALTWVTRHVRITRTLREDPILSPGLFGPDDHSHKRVSVLIPARNEEDNIRECVLDALALNYTPKEIIVVDDRSEDRTADIVAELARDHPELTLVKLDHLQPGWTGKTHALWAGVQKAHGDWLLFIDADTRHHPDNLDVTVAYAEKNNLDMISLLASLTCYGFWENLLQPLLGGALMIRFPLQKVNDPNSPLAFANGQYILVRREAYEAVGGHAAVRSDLLEDIAIAKALKSAGKRITTAFAPDISTTRMYSSFGDIVRGWARIFYYAFDQSLLSVFIGFMLIVVFSLLPYVLFAGSVIAAIAGAGGAVTTALAVVSGATCLLIYAALWRVAVFSKTDRRLLPLYPLGAVISAFVMVRAFLMRFSRRGVTWRGTTYATAAPENPSASPKP